MAGWFMLHQQWNNANYELQACVQLMHACVHDWVLACILKFRKPQENFGAKWLQENFGACCMWGGGGVSFCFKLWYTNYVRKQSGLIAYVYCICNTFTHSFYQLFHFVWLVIGVKVFVFFQPIFPLPDWYLGRMTC